MASTRKPRQHASRIYAARRKDIAFLVARLQACVEAHGRAAGDNVNWKHVGDLTEATIRLRDLAAFIDPQPELPDQEA